MPKSPATIGGNLRLLRTLLNISQREIAERMGINQETIRNYENARSFNIKGFGKYFKEFKK